MLELSLHLLDIVQNSISAGASLIRIEIEEDTERDSLVLYIEDNGRGMSREVVARVMDPFVTSRATRKVGLGLSLLREASIQSDGEMEVVSEEGKGTRVRAHFTHSHIDRMPLGDMAKTISVLIAGNPTIDFVYDHTVNGVSFTLDTRALRQYLEEIPLNDLHVVGFILQEVGAWMTRRKGLLREGGYES